jgi:hypothetical protein
MCLAIAGASVLRLAAEVEVIGTDRTDWIAAGIKTKRQNGIGG